MAYGFKGTNDFANNHKVLSQKNLGVHLFFSFLFDEVQQSIEEQLYV